MTMNPVEHVETTTRYKARWNIDATMRDAALVQMAMVIADKKSSDAAVCKASAVLLRAEAQNQRDEHRRKKKAVNQNVPVVHLGWNGTRFSESEIEKRMAEAKRQMAESAKANGRRRKRARRWNVKPEYRQAMVVRWAMILADSEASQTVKFAVASLMLRAEAQNQKDEEYRRKNPRRPQGPITVDYTRDFYGNAAQAFPDEADEASRADSGAANTKEDRDSRPEAGPETVGVGCVLAHGRFSTGPPE